MSERSDAPRSGGRPEQSRTTAGKRERGDGRDAAGRGATNREPARGARPATGRDDTRRSGTRDDTRRSEMGDDARRSGVRDETRRSGTRDDTRRSKMGDETRRSGTRDDTRRSGTRGGKGRAGADGPVQGTAALALEVTSIEVTSGESLATGRPRLWLAQPLPLRAPRATFAASVIVLVLAGVLGILLINTKTMEQSFRLDALRKEQAALDKQQQGLEQRLIQASDPGHLHAAARRLGLVMADEPAMIRLPDGKISRIPTPGRGPESPTRGEGLKPDATAGQASANRAGANQAGANRAGANRAGANQAGANQAGTPAAGAGR